MTIQFNDRMIRRFTGWFLAVTTLVFLGSISASAQSSSPPLELTEVEISIVLLDLRSINDSDQSFTANVFFMAQWHDHRLAHDGPDVLWRDLYEVWNPRLQIVNRQQGLALSMPQTVEVAPDGTVTYRQRAVGQFSQKLHLADFPFDRQAFEIQLLAVGYSPSEIVFVGSSKVPSGVVPELSLPDWTILEPRGVPRVYQPFPHIPPVAGFVFQVDATRKLGYYRWKIIIPLLLVVAMSWLVFWIDPELAGPQISVAVTSMLTLIAYRFMVSGMLPKVSYLTRMDQFISMSTLLVFLTLVEATLTVTLANRGKEGLARALDRTCRWSFPLAYVLALAWAAVH